MQTSSSSAGRTWSDLLAHEDFRRRLLFTLGALLLSRVGARVPLPGLNLAVVSDSLSGGGSGMFGWLSGGRAIERLSLLALALSPFVSAWLVTELIRCVTTDRDLGEFRRCLTAGLAAMQAWGIAIGLEGVSNLVPEPGWLFRATTVATLTAGTVFLLWLGEQITRRGLGDGVWLIVGTEFVLELPAALYGVYELARTGAVSTQLCVLVLALLVGVVALIVLVETAERRVPLERAAGAGTGPEPSKLTLRIDRATILPAYFASALLLLPLTAASILVSSADPSNWLTRLVGALGRGQPLYLTLYGLLIVLLTILYTAMVTSPEAMAARLRADGAAIAGVPPGGAAVHLDGIVTRLTLVCAVYLAALALLPELLIAHAAVPFYIGGTSLLITVLAALRVLGDVGRLAGVRAASS